MMKKILSDSFESIIRDDIEIIAFAYSTVEISSYLYRKESCVKGGVYMTSVQIVLRNETGLHARPASLFVREASKYKSEVKVIKDEKEYNAKSIMTILSMQAGKGTKLVIKAEGEDEKDVVKALKALIDNNFGK